MRIRSLTLLYGNLNFKERRAVWAAAAVPFIRSWGNPVAPSSTTLLLSQAISHTWLSGMNTTRSMEWNNWDIICTWSVDVQLAMCVPFYTSKGVDQSGKWYIWIFMAILNRLWTRRSTSTFFLMKRQVFTLVRRAQNSPAWLSWGLHGFFEWGVRCVFFAVPLATFGGGGPVRWCCLPLDMLQCFWCLFSFSSP